MSTIDPKGTCHLVMCPDKGKHAPHPGPMAAPTTEQYREQLRQAAALRNAAAVRPHPFVSYLRRQGESEWKPWTRGSLEDVLEDLFDFRHGNLGNPGDGFRIETEMSE